MAGKYKAGLRAFGQKTVKSSKCYLTKKEQEQLIKETEEWQPVGRCEKLPPLNSKEKWVLIKTKGNARRETKKDLIVPQETIEKILKRES